MAMDQPEEEETRPPISLFRAIFAETSSSSSESEEEKDVEPPSEPSSALQEPAPPPERPQLRFIRRNERMQSETDGTSLSSTIKAVTIPEEVAIDLDAGPAGNSNSQAQEGPGLYGPALPPETTELGKCDSLFVIRCQSRARAQPYELPCGMAVLKRLVCFRSSAHLRHSPS